MSSRMFIFAPPVLAGVVLSIAVVLDRGTGSDLALERAARQPAVDARKLERAISSAPEPVPSGRGSRARRVSCRALEGRRRWRCRATYGGGSVIVYRVAVRPDGSFAGRDAQGVRSVSGRL